MYRKKSTTTPGRRITRTVRTSVKRRRPGDGRGGGVGGGGADDRGGLKQRFQRAAERPAQKWVLVTRPPASTISFTVKTWVPYSKLTFEERALYDGTTHGVIPSAGEGGATRTTLGGDHEDLHASETISTHLPHQPLSEVAQTPTSLVATAAAVAAAEEDMFPITSNFLFNDPSVDAFMSGVIVEHDDVVGVHPDLAAAAAAATTHPRAERTVEFPTNGEDRAPTTKRARIEEPHSAATPGPSSWDWHQ